MNTKTRNAKFTAATKAQKRVMIAKDVLALMKAKKIRPRYGSFVSADLPKATASATQICDVFADKAKPIDCRCCALGAMMVSEIRHMDAITLGDVGDSEPTQFGIWIDRASKGDRLENYFSTSQLETIEIAFERGGGYYQVYSQSPRGKRVAAEMFDEDDRPDKRMTEIMRNIVANNGTFKPVKR